MNISALQLYKNSDSDNANAWLHNTLIVDYGRVVKVIDVQTVVVEAVVQTSSSIERFTVTLLSLSSALLEISDAPKVGDSVLLLFLRKHDPTMFIKDTVNNADATGYNRFSGVGILMSTVKSIAHTTLSLYYDSEEQPVVDLISNAETYGTFNNLMTLMFCRAVFDSEDEALINILFGVGRPLIEEHLARAERKHGFWKDPENELIQMDASVTERYSPYAPIVKDVQGAQTTDVGLGTDKDDAPVETDAPIVETVHGKASIARDIRCPQTTVVGIGNSESGDDAEERDAPVEEVYGSKAPIAKDIRGTQTYKVGIGPNGDTDAAVSIEMGEKSEITLDSKSGMTLHFSKAVLIKSDDDYSLQISGDVSITGSQKITVKADGDIAIKASGDVNVEAFGDATVKGTNVTIDAATLLTLKSGDATPWMPNVMPVCPLGPLHGGPGAGIAKLKGG